MLVKIHNIHNYMNLSFVVCTIRAFMVSRKLKPEEAVQATLSSLPDEVVDTVGITSLPSEDSVSERRRKLEYLEMQEELIKVLIIDSWCFIFFSCSFPAPYVIFGCI